MSRASLDSCIELAAGLVAREPWAERELIDRFSLHVERIILRITGDPSEIDDGMLETFLRVMNRAHELRDPAGLPGFVTQVAVNVSREALRTRRRRSWLRFLAPEAVSEIPIEAVSDDVRGAYEAVYQVLDELTDESRIVFVLRHVEEMKLGEIAETLSLSLATTKRRLVDAERAFYARAERAPELKRWLMRSPKWT